MNLANEASQSAGPVETSKSPKDIENGAGIRRLEEWLVIQGLRSTGLSDLLDGFGEALNKAGLPILRLFVGLNTLHPIYRGYGFTWVRGEGIVDTEPFRRGNKPNANFLNSPFHHMFANELLTMKLRLDQPGEVDFDIFKRFREAGGTDYYAKLVSFNAEGRHTDPESSSGMMSSVVSDQPGGLDEVQIAQLDQLILALGLAVKVKAVERAAISVAETYLGRDAGRRVLRGEIDRGSVTSIRAVIFFADLRGFTRLADQMAPRDLVMMLDEYLEAMTRPVIDNGGEVLKFMGDGVLATFEIADGERAVECQRALEAAGEAFRANAELSARRASQGLPTMELDLVLHVGDVMYGNVGGVERLDFTVIGPAVNEASRLEAMCRSLGTNLLISEDFAAGASMCSHMLISLGIHKLRDIATEKEIFSVDPAILGEWCNCDQICQP